MVKKVDTNKARIRRHKRVRGKVSGTAECPRLNVFRSSANIYAQIIDDTKGVTLCSASSLDKDFEGCRNSPKAPVRAASSSKEEELLWQELTHPKWSSTKRLSQSTAFPRQ